jgi:hypothetical protein
LLDDPEMLQGVTELNQQIASLAPVINSGSPTEKVSVESSNPEVPVAVMFKVHEGSTYVFAAGMREGKTAAKFKLPGVEGTKTISVLGEGREITSKDGSFTDDFGAWDVHLYRIGKGTD